MEPNLLNLLRQGNGLLLAGLILLGLGVLSLVVAINGFFSSRLKKSRLLVVRRDRMSISTLFFRVLLSLILVFFALSVFLTGAVLRTYTAFTQQDLIGTLECLQANAASKSLVVRFVPEVSGNSQRAQTYTLPGDQWEVNARILKWTPQANLLGLHTAYRLNLIKGVYAEAADENTRAHHAYALNPGQDWVWTLLTRFGKYLPFVEAVYGNAVSNPVQTGEVYELFVTNSGLSAKKK
ncbi:MAG: hypothetical protein HGA76_09930 [Candidatus Firestonebacteria bacterium]|nr:hypothetical protein [Candidatus Firestonebacteria bacterium]